MCAKIGKLFYFTAENMINNSDKSQEIVFLLNFLVCLNFIKKQRLRQTQPDIAKNKQLVLDLSR